MGGKQIWLNTNQITSKNEHDIDKKVSLETLSEVFKPVVLEKYEF